MAKSKYWSNNCAFSSDKDNWTTPPELFKKLDDEFHFTLDLCADKENALCDRFFSLENSLLDAEFSGETCYCNPPYGKKVTELFVKKCVELANNGNDIVMLLPARTETKMFHKYIYNKAEIRFIEGRLHFSGSKNPAPFPSMIVIFRGKKNGEE